MNNSELKINENEELIINQIYFIRGQKVMLDRDLAKLYEVETKNLKRQVDRNRERFPSDFMFELNEQELNNWRRQFGTSNSSIKMGLRYSPYAFTEQGIAMLSSVLNSKKAIEVNIRLIRLFIRLRQVILDQTELKVEIEKLERKTENNSKNIELVFQYIDELGSKKNSNKIQRKKIGYKMPKEKKKEI